MSTLPPPPPDLPEVPGTGFLPPQAPDPSSAPEPEPATASGRPAWPPITAFFAIALGLATAIFGGLIIAIIGTAFGADVEDTPPSIALISTVVQDACFVGAVIFFASRVTPVRPWQLGWRGTRFWPAVGWMAAAFFSLLIISYAWTTILGIDDKENLPDSLGVDKSNIALAATAVLVTVIAPIAEELLFRAYVFPALRNWRGTAPAVVLTGLLFGLLHVVSSPAYALLPLSAFGALLCLLYLRTKSLYPCIALHSLNNSVAFGTAPEVSWGWQVPLLAVGALATLALIAYAVRRRFGTPPPGLSAV